ncbi:putative syntaxin-like protein psy1 [Tothia fuscella]|uniref:Syntaxin-like protein psy1 n=1 Tax=Tothia fuscella TaxID=1048955 RepID=A0A9P4NEY3_9PEZI|nr:putative syntaxin-like protein psy1 [Tothia fuscella]
MSQGYNQYGGNPYGGSGGYEQSQHGGYGGGGYNQSGNPYANNDQQHLGQPPLNQQISQTSNYSQQGTPGMTPQNTVAPQSHGPNVMSNQDFLTRVDGVRKQIDSLSNQVSSIASAHQRAISSPDGGSSAQVEHLVSQTQVLNTQIKDQIKYLETDAARSGGNVTKDSQIRNLKSQFTSRLEQYRQEESQYKKRYQEQIARQYKIVNPEASEDEVREAAQANWGDEGVFQTALKSNRHGAATSVLGAVRARHNDIQKIEQTLEQLNQLFQDLAEAVIIQDTAVQAAEEQTDHVVKDTEQANVQLGKGVEHARRARKLKWWCLGLVVLIIVILGLALGIYFGVTVPNRNKNSGP